MADLSGIYRLSIGTWRYIGQAANLRKRRNKHLSELAKRSASLMGNKNALGHVQSVEHKAKATGHLFGRKKPAAEIIRRQATRIANAAAAGGGYHGFKNG